MKFKSTTNLGEIAPRLAFIDNSKGIAIIFVVIGHVVYHCICGKNNSAYTHPIFILLQSFHMPLFIFLSGILVSNQSQNFKEVMSFSYKKFRQLLVPFLIIGGALTIANGKGIETLLTSSMKSGYWFLLTLFELFILHSLKLLVQHEKKGNKLTFDVLLTIFTYLCLYSINELWGNTAIGGIVGIGHLCTYYPYFAVATIVKKCDYTDKLFESELFLTAALIVVFCKMILVRTGLNIAGYGFLLSLSYLYLCIAIMYRLEDTHNVVTNTLGYLGRNSLYIYVFHYFLIINTPLWFVQSFTNDNSLVLDIIIITIPTALIILLSLLFGNLIKECHPLHKIIFGR